MKITKHEHAFIDIELDGRRLLVDPGVFTPSIETANVDGVVVTHDHDDHVSAAHLEALLAANPELVVFGDAAVAAKLAPLPVQLVEPGQTRTVGGFTLDFLGTGAHAEIHSSIPRSTNLTVLVNDAVYHPGDSLDLPGRPVQLAAVPLSGPWHKLAEAVDFVRGTDAAVNFGIHEALLSEAGVGFYSKLLSATAQAAGHTFTALPVGESLEV